MPSNLSGYVDGHSLTASFKPGITTVKENLECKVNNVRKCIIENSLRINDSNTGFLIFGARNNLDKHTIASLKVGDSDIINNKSIKFLGVILDPYLAFKDNISNKSNIYYITYH